MTHEEIQSLWLSGLRDNANDTVKLLSNSGKQEREKRTAAAFLRCVGVAFTSAQLAPSKTEPPDVLFGPANFEIVEVLDGGRKRHDEWKDSKARFAAATAVSELFVPYHPSEMLSRQQVIDLITPTATNKANKYVKCEELDLLLYVNKKDVALDVNSSPPKCDTLKSQKWRSVSVLFPPYGYVVLASNAAPAFICALIEKPTAAWPRWDGLFDI